MNVEAALAEFHDKFGVRSGTLSDVGVHEAVFAKASHLREELNELFLALSRDDLPEIADALADLVYLCYGMARMLHIPLDEVLTEVHRANLDKIKVPVRDHRLGIVKPQGWLPPDVEGILARAGLLT